MKKTILYLLILIPTVFSNADYILKYQMEEQSGGFLPKSSIKFKENIVDIDIKDCLEQGQSESCDEMLGAWEDFAIEKSLPYSWNNINWNSKSLTELPYGPYPLTTANEIIVAYNQLSNLSGLDNLQNVWHLSIAYNQLTNLNELSNLINVNYLSIIGNQLNNIDGISQTKVINSVAIDSNYSGKKLSASSRFCMENVNSVYSPGYAQKNQLCE